MALIDEINKMRQEIRTDGYPMSINEWISLYEHDEIDIHPEFQRYYRWSLEQKSRLIESILLGIPIPQIFVSQRKDGVWDIVDGLQRLSTIFEFVGILKDEDGKKLPPLVLNETQYLPSLEGKKWEDEYDPKNSLKKDEQLLIKRSKISASILLRESDDVAKFELFQRLNTGGSLLTPQEVRNSMLVMANPKMFDWIKELSKYDLFQNIINLSEPRLQEQYDVELLLRFLIFSTLDEKNLKKINDIGVFITKNMLEMANNQSLDKQKFEDSFKMTFDVLDSTVGKDAFRRYDTAKKKFTGRFLLSSYEVVAYGIGFNYKNLPENVKIEGIIKEVWNNSEFIKNSGSGTTASRRLPNLVPLGRKLFKK